jgi:hypothetical protein
MAYAYRLSRRMAQITILGLFVLSLSCADSQSPESAPSPSSDNYGVLSGDKPLALTRQIQNEPLGFLQMNARPFQSKVEAGWLDRGDAAFSIASDASAPISPSTIGRANFRQGFKGGSAPINTWYVIGGAKRTKLYISFWFKMSPNWQGHKSGVNKIFFFQINHKNMVNLDAHGSGASTLRPHISAQGINEDPVTRVFKANLNGAEVINRGQWEHWEAILTANTPGQPNGSVEWWLNGIRVGYHTNINYLPVGANNYWEEVKWNPTWGGVGDTVLQSQNMWIDDVYISGI